jgi:hypothetical protein
MKISHFFDLSILGVFLIGSCLLKKIVTFYNIEVNVNQGLTNRVCRISYKIISDSNHKI